MKYPILIALVIMVPILAKAQDNDGVQTIIRSGSTSESFESTIYHKSDRMPFRDIIVIDKRFDSSKTGYRPVAFNNFSRIELKDSWSTILNNYFKKNLDTQSRQSLVIIIKSFWLQTGLLDHTVQQKVIEKPVVKTMDMGTWRIGSGDVGGSCTASIDLFVQTDSSLQALFRIDTLFMNTTRYNKNNIDEFFFLPFDSAARKISTLSIPDALSRKKKFSWPEVSKHYDQRFDLPVLKAPAIRKGIFLSFDDFRQNNPSTTEFVFRNGKLTDELYTVAGGKEELVVKYWGFSDGKQLFIQAGLNAFRAIRQKNTFEILGAHHLSNKRDQASPYSLRKETFRMKKKIMQVNMENGKIY